jgi:molybdopterin synthase catalytic subunit
MQVRVLFFGALKELVKEDSEVVFLPERASVENLLEHYRQERPTLKEWLKSIAVSVNHEYAAQSRELSDGDEVGLLPPVSGGLTRTTITRDKIDTEKILAALKQPEDGAAVVFEGIVRDNTRGRRTLYLHYEAYEEMAAKQLEALAEKAISLNPVRDVNIIHRLGRLEIGETSVLIVVASAHRGPAFDACRWLIDTLKRTVPIWKKEFFDDGAVWADGEPFPSEIAGTEGTHSAKDASKLSSQ